MTDDFQPQIEKQHLRNKLLLRRESLTLETPHDRFHHNLLSWERFQKTKRVLCYTPFRGEVDLMPLIAACSHKAWYLPVIQPLRKIQNASKQTLTMVFYRYFAGNSLHPGEYGILEPEPIELLKAIQSTDMILVPGLAFDRNGYRLGYGQGYYDRFLDATHKQGIFPCTVGVVLSALLQDSLPIEAWDIPTDFLLTEAGLQATK